VSIRQTLDVCYLCWLSKPKADRAIFQYLRKHSIKSMVELGVRDETRSLAMVRLAQYRRPGEEIRYAGIDLFEARTTSQSPLTLKQMHQAMNRSKAAVRLIPGDAFGALARAANQLQGTDLLVISAGHDEETLARAWMYVPRLLSAEGQVLMADGPVIDGQPAFRLLDAAEVEERAKQSQKARRSAA